jgi:outer membrane protein assembly factor BamB
MGSICTSVDLPGGAGRVVVFDWETGSGREENLVCFEPGGRVRWKAKLPTSDPSDCFVAVALDGDLVRANSMSCYAVWLDPATGRTVRTQFTK